MSAAKCIIALGGFRCAHPPYVRRVSVVLASFLSACQSGPRVEILPPRAMLVQPVLPKTVAPRHKP